MTLTFRKGCPIPTHIFRVSVTKLANERGRLATKVNSDFAFYQPPLIQLVKIHLATATFDQIEKDVKVTTEAALGLIGGTMGLFTGFSILSGIEIICHIAKFFMSLRLNKADNQRSKTIKGVLYCLEICQ